MLGRIAVLVAAAIALGACGATRAHLSGAVTAHPGPCRTTAAGQSTEVTVTNPTRYSEIVQLQVGTVGVEVSLGAAATQTLTIGACGALTARVLEATQRTGAVPVGALTGALARGG